MISLKKIIVLIGIILLVCGCEENTVKSNGKKVDTSKMLHEHCTRSGSAGAGVTVSLNYEIYSTGEILNIVQSTERIETTIQETLDQYESAYKGIHEHYAGLEYYDAKVERTNNSVTSYITINYDKIDIGKLIDIEGEDDNVFENKVPKLAKWKELAKKVGTKCEVVED